MHGQRQRVTPPIPCGALFDALRAMELVDAQTHDKAKQLLVRIVSMLSKMC